MARRQQKNTFRLSEQEEWSTIQPVAGGAQFSFNGARLAEHMQKIAEHRSFFQARKNPVDH
jgi:hypothetical protein